MVTNNVFSLALPVSIAIFGVLAKFALDMKRDEKPRQMWGYLCWSLVPFAVVALMWLSQGDIDVTIRNLTLGLIGAAVGATALIWAGYIVSQPAPFLTSSPQYPPSSAQPAGTPSAFNTTGEIKANSGIISQGQQGDNSIR